MWIGLLTAGPHPERPPSAEGLATLFTWGPRERARIDGPQWALCGGVRAMRQAARAGLGPFNDPRCFECRQPYPLPDPDELRADADAREVGGKRPDPGPPPPPPSAAAAPPIGSGPAVFAAVHVWDGPADDSAEVLVLIPGSGVASLIPLGALGVFAGIVREAGFEPLVCERCGTMAPGGSLGEPLPGANRAARRAGSGRRHAA